MMDTRDGERGVPMRDSGPEVANENQTSKIDHITINIWGGAQSVTKRLP